MPDRAGRRGAARFRTPPHSRDPQVNMKREFLHYGAANLAMLVVASRHLRQGTGISGRRAMNLSRRDLAAAAGVFALGAVAFAGPVLANTEDEAAVKKAVEELKAAWLKQDKAKLEAMTLPQLSYSHSDARLEDKAKFIEGVMGRKATVKSLEFPDTTVQVVGNTAIVRHLWVSQTELEGKVTDTKIGVMQVWQKQDGGWKLLARASYRLPQQA